MYPNKFDTQIAEIKGDWLYSDNIETLQVNLGLVCNQECKHCHLEASPKRKEQMDWPTMNLVIAIANEMQCKLIDVTGGAPELNPNFYNFVRALRKNGHRVQTRTNLSILMEPEMEKMPFFFREQEVEIVASLPCYLKDNVNKQRGQGAYNKSIMALKRLNSLGYGKENELPLRLVYNPGGPFLSSEQALLEIDYRLNLSKNHGITFTNLFTINNMPIGRFKRELQQQNKEQEYFQLLYDSFNPQAIDNLMCRHQLSVGWNGLLYDCDFNLALGYPVNQDAPNKLEKFELKALANRRIVTGNHCFGCTAGNGSSCSGAIVL